MNSALIDEPIDSRDKLLMIYFLGIMWQYNALNQIKVVYLAQTAFVFMIALCLAILVLIDNFSYYSFIREATNNKIMHP